MIQSLLLAADPTPASPYVSILAFVVPGLIGIVGALLAGWLQSRVTLRQARESNEHSLKLLQQQFTAQEAQRQKQNAEAENADRLRVLEYVELLIPRLHAIASLNYLGDDNHDAEELKRYQDQKRYIGERTVDASSPQKTGGLRIAFITFQIAAAMRLALLARWTRPVSDDHARFLNYWELDLEPIICSGRYPGAQFLYREQLEIAAQEMLTLPATTQIPRPLNWSEFVTSKYNEDHVLKDLSHFVSGKLEYIFDSSNSLAARKATQCRLAIMGLYMIKLTEEAGFDSWKQMADTFWETVVEEFQHQQQQGYHDGWFVFARGDVQQRATENAG